MLRWNPKAFFRRVHPDALRLLLHSSSVRFALDGDGALADQAYRAWRQISPHRRRQLDVTLQQICLLSTPHARPFLDELASEVWGSDALAESRRWTANDLSVCLFVSDERAFEAAVERYGVEPDELVFEFRAAAPAVPTRSAAAKRQVARHVEAYLSETPFGRRCHVEDFVDGDRLVVTVAYQADRVPVEDLQASGLVVRRHRPLVWMAAVYLVESATLFVQAAQQPEVSLLRDVVADVYFDNLALFASSQHYPRFRFDVLFEPEATAFPTKGEDDIQTVSLIQVVAMCPHRVTTRFTLDLRPSTTLAEARAVLLAHGITLPQVVGIRLRFAFTGQGRSRFRTVVLQNPNLSNFDGTSRDCLVRRYLQKWGIDAEPSRTVGAATHDVAPRR